VAETATNKKSGWEAAAVHVQIFLGRRIAQDGEIFKENSSVRRAN
jgi:hypothetical protein